MVEAGLSKNRRLIGFIAIDVVGAILVVQSGLVPVVSSHPVSQLAVRQVRKADSPIVPPPALAAFRETLSRPVFFRSRRPGERQIAPQPLRSAVPSVAFISDPHLTLSGIILSKGHKRAYLATSANPGGGWVDEGETVDGWVLRSVDTNTATLIRGLQKVLLNLYEAPSSR